MNDEKISIIIPVYNTEKYINQCLNSIINQTYENLEIIIINDGSNDKSLDIIEEYIKKDKRIILLNQLNSGVSVARNNALRIKTGNFVMFVDSDDWIELNTCELLIKEMKKNKSDIVIYNICKEYKNYKKYNPQFKINIQNNSSLNNFIQAKIIAPQLKIKEFIVSGIEYACNKIIKSELIENIFFQMEYKKAIWEDALFFSKVMEKKCKVSFLNKYFYHYRMNVNSATNSSNSDIIEINRIVYNSLISLKNRNELINDAIAIRMTHNLRQELTLYIFNRNFKLNFNQRVILLKKEIKKDIFSESIKKVKIKKVDTNLKIYILMFKLRLYLPIYILNKLEQGKRNLKLEE